MPGVALHDWQPPEHDWLQHTPSTQKLDWHWLESVQLVPFCSFATHEGAAQKLEKSHWLSVVHDVLHAPAPLHEKPDGHSLS